MSWPIVLDEVSKVGKEASAATATVQKAAKPKTYAIPFGVSATVSAATFGEDGIIYFVTSNSGTPPFSVLELDPKTGRIRLVSASLPSIGQQLVVVGNMLYINGYSALWSVNVDTGAFTSLASISGESEAQQLIALDDYPDYLYLIDTASSYDQLRRYSIASNTWSFVTQTLTRTTSSGRICSYDGTYLYLSHQGRIDRYDPVANTCSSGHIILPASGALTNAFYSSGINPPINGASIFVRSLTRTSSSSAYLAAFGFRIVNGSTVELEVLPFDAIAHMWNQGDPSTPVRVMPYTQNGLYNPATDTLLLLESYAMIIYQGVKANAAGL